MNKNESHLEKESHALRSSFHVQGRSRCNRNALSAPQIMTRAAFAAASTKLSYQFLI